MSDSHVSPPPAAPSQSSPNDASRPARQAGQADAGGHGIDQAGQNAGHGEQYEIHQETNGNRTGRRMRLA
ncbi:hypothetical protein ACQCQQ_15775, partial [Ralstonia pseudosolanacearum]